MNEKITFLVIILLVLFSCLFVEADYGGVTLSAWTYEKPTIDGEMGLGEWWVADHTDFTTIGTMYQNVPDFNGTVWVMNDAENLYMFIRFRSSLADGGIRIMFDNDNDEDEWDLGDDAIFYGWDSEWDADEEQDEGFKDKHFSSWPDDGRQDGAGASLHLGNIYPLFRCVEFSHPLDSGDPEDFSLAIGDTVGFQIYIFDVCLGEGYWPSQGQTTNDIFIAGKVRRPVGGELLPFNQSTGYLLAIAAVVSMVLSYSTRIKSARI